MNRHYRKIITFALGMTLVGCGQAGIDGSPGVPGAPGAPGLQGARGIQGLPGLQGDPGPVGAQGLPGAPGAQGPAGAQGIQGLPGAQGAQGPAGAQGIQGLPGAQGAQGPAGAQGIQGLTGAQGAQGLTGAQGAQGVPGPQGAQGLTGAQGAQGVPGAQGAQGPAGAQGAQGPAGTPADLTALVFGQAGDNVFINAGTDWSNGAVFAATTGHQPLDFNFGNLTVAPGVTLTVPSGITIRCRGQLLIGAGAVVTVKSPIVNVLSFIELGSVSMGGSQASAGTVPSGAQQTVGLTDPFPFLTLPLAAGGSGAPIHVAGGTVVAGRGGGTLAIRALGGINNQGTLNAVGSNGLNAGGVSTGGGGGGLVLFMWGSGAVFTNSGTINTSGGGGPVAPAGQAGAGGGGGGFIRLVGPGAGAVGGTLNVAGGLGSANNGAVLGGTHVSPGGASQGTGGAVNNLGAGSDGGVGLAVRTDVSDPIALVSLGKQLSP